MGLTSSRSTKKTRQLGAGVGLAKDAGAKIAQSGNHEEHSADQKDGDVAAENDDGVFPGDEGALFNREHEEHGAHQQFVGDGVEVLSENGLLMQGAGEEAVEAVAQSGENEQGQRPFEIVLDQIDHDEGQKDHAQQRELVGRGQDLPEVHRPCSPRVSSGHGRRAPPRNSLTRSGAGSCPVFSREALGEREEIAFGKVEFHALHAMHGKENDAGSEGLAVLDLGGEIVERRDIDAAQAEAFARKLENRSPEFFAGVGQRGDDERAGAEGADGLGILIKACTGHVGLSSVGWGKCKRTISWAHQAVGQTHRRLSH